MALSPKKMSLPEVIRLLRERCGDAPTYAVMWRAVAEGRVPAERCGSQWGIDPAKVPEVAAAFGLKLPAPVT